MTDSRGAIFVSPVFRNVEHPFRDRTHAGVYLSEFVRTTTDGDLAIVAFSLGGLDVATPMARVFHSRVDFFPVLPLAPSWSRSLIYGAVAFDGSVVLEQQLIDEAGLSSSEVRATIREQTPLFRELFVHAMDLDSREDLRGLSVLIVDDGSASVSVLRATVGAVRNAHAARVIVATVAASPYVLRRLAHEADSIYCARELRHPEEQVFRAPCRAPTRAAPSERRTVSNGIERLRAQVH